jgi:8-oxo-dGTP pyrophosphatase MutT (NUDIX family)
MGDFMNAESPSILSALHQLKSIALEGLRFTQNPYDIERYNRLLEVTASGYAEMLAIDSAQMLEQLRSQIGIVTPKLGADAAVPNELGQILLLNRSDGRGWGLPGGWVDVHESPAQAAVREVWEEAGLRVEPVAYSAISCKGPQTGILYHQVNIATLMKPVPAGIAVTLSHEHTDYRWIGELPQDIKLHAGHDVQIRKIFAFLGAGAAGLAAE